MPENRKSASAEQLKGSVKEALGKLTGDSGIEAEGRRQKKAAGSAKHTGPKSDGSGRV